MLLAVQAMTPNALAECFETSRQAVPKDIRILVECDLLEQSKGLMAKRFSQPDVVLNRLKKRKK